MPLPGSDRDAPISWRAKARYGAWNTGVKVDCPAAGTAASVTRPRTSRGLRGIGFSLNVFGHYPDGIVDHLEETAPHGEAEVALRASHGETPLTEERGERGVPRKDTYLPVNRGSHDGAGVAIEHRRLGGNYCDVHHALASFLAFSTASSIPPTM